MSDDLDEFQIRHSRMHVLGIRLLPGLLIPFNRPPKSLRQAHLSFEAELLFGSCRVQHPPRLAVRLRGVPLDISLEAGQLCNHPYQVFDPDFFTYPEVDRLGLLVMLCGKENPLGGNFHIQELPAGRYIDPKKTNPPSVSSG